MVHTVLIMHQPLASAFARCAQHVLGCRPRMSVYDIPADADAASWGNRLKRELANSGADDVLILCDLVGATPFNIASQAAQQCHAAFGTNIRVLAGANLNMVLKAITDPINNLDALTESVRKGGVRGMAITGPGYDSFAQNTH